MGGAGREKRGTGSVSGVYKTEETLAILRGSRLPLIDILLSSSEFCGDCRVRYDICTTHESNMKHA